MINNLDKAGAEKLSRWASHIVVGAGAAGCIVAARLSEDPKNTVLIIELGPNNVGNPMIAKPANSSLLWDHPDGPSPSPSDMAHRTIPQLERRYRYPRGNGLGGSTNHHSLVDGIGSGKIYDGIAKLVGDDRWAFKNVERYFRKMEAYRTTTSDVAGTRILPVRGDIPFASSSLYNAAPLASALARGDPRSPLTDELLSGERAAAGHGKTGWLQVRPGTVKAPLHRELMQAAADVTGAPLRANTIEVDGISVSDMQIRPDGGRSASFNDLLLPAMSRGNIVVLFNTLTSRVLIESGDKKMRAAGVEIIHRENVYTANHSASDKPIAAHSIDVSKAPLISKLFASKEIILCGGAINTPQILMLSGIGPKAHLEKIGIPIVLDLPGVGSDLLDHHEVNVVFEINPIALVWPGQAGRVSDRIEALLPQVADNPTKITQLTTLKNHLTKFVDRQEQYEGSGEVVIDWYSGMPSDIDHDLHITCGEDFFFDFDLKSIDPLPDGKIRSDYIRSQDDPMHAEFFRVFHHCLIETMKISRADGTIRLASSDPTVPPLIDLALYKDDEANERMARGIQMVRKIIQHPSMRKYYKLSADGTPLEHFPGPAYQTIPQLKDYVSHWSAIGHHIAGTAKMGMVGDPRAVVDSELRVLGVPNLRVADTSVYPFPYLHGYNTSRAAYLIGEMVSDFIRSPSEIKSSAPLAGAPARGMSANVFADAANISDELKEQIRLAVQHGLSSVNVMENLLKEHAYDAEQHIASAVQQKFNEGMTKLRSADILQRVRGLWSH